MKGMMAAGAAVAAMPYLANLAGSVQARPSQVATVGLQAQASPTSKVASPASSFGGAIPNDAETLVLVIRNDVISGFKGLQQDEAAGLADGERPQELVQGEVRVVKMTSHREAPGISADPAADNTDVYAFVSPDKPSTVTLISNFIPLQAAQAGPNFYRFDPPSSTRS